MGPSLLVSTSSVPADLISFTEEILNGKPHLLSSFGSFSAFIVDFEWYLTTAF